MLASTAPAVVGTTPANGASWCEYHSSHSRLPAELQIRHTSMHAFFLMHPVAAGVFCGGRWGHAKVAVVPETRACDSSPCQGRGRCVDQDVDQAGAAGTYTCLCPPGRTGSHCETVSCTGARRAQLLAAAMRDCCAVWNNRTPSCLVYTY